MLVQQRADIAFADFRVRAERAFQVINVGQQRLLLAAGGLRHDAGAALGRALVQQLRRARRVFAHNHQSRGGVAHFHRQGDMAARLQVGALEVHLRHRQAFTACADGGGFDILRRVGAGADRRHRKTRRIARHRQQAICQPCRREHRRTAIALERIAQGLAVRLDPIAQPVKRWLRIELEASQRLGSGLAVAHIRHGLQFLGDARRFAFIQQAGRHVAGGGNDGDGAALRAVQQIGDQLLPRVPVFRRGPAIVDHQHQGSRCRQLG